MTKHKVALSVLSVLFASSVAFGQSWSGPEIAVSSNTLTMVAGPAGARWSPQWTTNTAYAQGAVVKNQGSVYFALVAGTSTNAVSTGPLGAGKITDGTVTWRKAPSGSRTTLSVQDVGTNTSCKTYVVLSYGAGPNVASAVLLYSGGSVSYGPGEAPQTAAYVLSTHNTSIITTE